ncbi:MAG: pirin-like C-terminal cupin domain-containing protein, partial [Pseudomonadota bacterium]
GIQTWIALPVEHEEIEPSFHHHPKEALPSWTEGDWELRLIAGSAFDQTSPVTTYSPMFYVDCHAKGAGGLSLPPALGERAVYCAEGSAKINDTLIEAGQMAIGEDDENLMVTTAGSSRLMLLGGEAFAEPRHIWWNFVSSRIERIEQAKQEWRDGRFSMVDGDSEFIPLPEK